MLTAPIPTGEPQRLEALHAYQAFQTGPEPGFDRITSLACRTLGVPTAYVSLVGEDTQWLKSCFNLPGPRETTRDIAFCAHAILCDDVFVVPDTHLDPRFCDSPLVTGEPHVRFYAGCPLRNPSGHNVGTLCAIDTVARVPTPEMLSGLRDLAALVVDQLELRKWMLEEEGRQKHHAETNYRRLSEAIHGLVFRSKITGPEAVEHLYVSQGSQELLGVLPDDLLQDPSCLTDMIHPEDESSYADAMSRVLAHGADWKWTGRVVTAHRHAKWVQGEGRCERQPDGSHIVEGLIVDISELKEREAALSHAKEAAERANQAKSEFLSRMSHELRTPMNAILGFAQMLEMAPLDVDAEADLAQIRKAGEHLLGLINDVLDLASVDARKLSMSVEPVRLDDVINESVGLLRPLFESGGIRLSTEALDGAGFVLADRQRLKQIVLNLMTNAAKYNRKGGLVTLRATRREGGVELEVQDQGPGIDAGKIERLFTPFDRLGAEASGIEGTGLGLSISRGFAEMMGGRLSVRSAVGEGSVFTLRLPEAECPVGALAALPKILEAVAPSRSSRNVLYVEDNESNILLVQRILRQRPQTCLTVVKSVAEGIECLMDGLPDAILLDVNLPDGTGEAIVRWVRGEAAVAGLPIIVLSADATPRQAERLIEAGADHYLTKPLNLDSFLATLDEALGEGAE